MWDGWQDFNPEQPETCQAVLFRFLTIAEANAPFEACTDQVRLQELTEMVFIRIVMRPRMIAITA